MKTILVVEDVSVSRRILVSTLLPRGYEVAQASEGRAAIRLLTSDDTIAAALIDLGLPDISGEVIMRWIRRRERNEGAKRIPIVAITGYTDEKKHLSAMQSGADDVFVKPIMPHQLLGWLEGALS